MDETLGTVLALSTAALDALGLKFAVVGGLAVSAWALPRTTRDVDLYADIPTHAQASLQRELEARSFHVPAMAAELRQFEVFRSKHIASGVFLDIFDAVGPLGESILRRRQRLVIATYDVWIISPEDLALLKAFSDRPRDFDDLVTLCSHLGSRLDHSYIDEWARSLDESIGTSEVSARIQRAHSEATAARRK